MGKKIGIGAGVLAAILAVFAGVVSMQPATYHVERSGVVNAPAAAVWEHIADFHKWHTWSPWSERDPKMKLTYVGEAGVVGSSYAWKGNDDVGSGKMTIKIADKPKHLQHELAFLAPMESTATSGFKLSEKDGKTTVVWYMDGNNNFVGKIISLLMDMDAMIGADYEKGLKTLAAQVERGAAKGGVKGDAKVDADAVESPKAK